MPDAAASCDIAETKELKSPPQRAAKEGVARTSVASTEAQKAKKVRKCMGSRFDKRAGARSARLARPHSGFETCRGLMMQIGRRPRWSGRKQGLRRRIDTGRLIGDKPAHGQETRHQSQRRIRLFQRRL